MESLLRYWVFDSRVLPCFKHGRNSLIYAWILPLLVNLAFTAAIINETQFFGKESTCDSKLLQYFVLA